MAKLSHGADTWRSEGLAKKYKAQASFDMPAKHKSKKDTKKWCRGKVGREHVWHRFQRRYYNWELDDYISPYIEIICQECGKEKYIKTAKSADYPLHLWVTKKGSGYEPIQVRVNGKWKPIQELRYRSGKYWCNDCGYWH